MNWQRIRDRIESRYRKPWDIYNLVSENFAADWVMSFKQWLAAKAALENARKKPSPQNETEVMFWKSKILHFRGTMRFSALLRTQFLFEEKKFKKRVKAQKGK